MRALLAPIRSHPVASFVLVAFGLSWAAWIPMAVRGEVVTAGGGPSHFAGLLGPLAAALVVSVVSGGAGGPRALVARLARWRVGRGWYVAAVLPAAIFAVAIAIQGLAGGSVPSAADLASFSGLPVLPLPVVVLLVLAGNGLGEEGGWRGFLLPALREGHGRFVSSALVALVWFAWHVPLFWIVATYRSMGLAVVPMMGVGLLAGSIVLTWLTEQSGRSVVPAAIWHTTLNLGSATAAGAGLAGIVLWNAVLVWAIAIGVGWVMSDRLERAANEVRESAIGRLAA
jgi:membrane protease YdiL (CAAX protease family)